MPLSLTKQQLSKSFAYASLACSLSFWLEFGLGYLYLRLGLAGLGWLIVFPAWKWVVIEAFALLLAIIATVIGPVVGAKLWRIALPVAVLMFLLTMYIMGS
jgi:hypothetical protein